MSWLIGRWVWAALILAIVSLAGHLVFKFGQDSIITDQLEDAYRLERERNDLEDDLNRRPVDDLERMLRQWYRD